MPVIAQTLPTTLPAAVVGCISPYPTVVMVTIAHQKAPGMLLKCDFSPLTIESISAKHPDIVLSKTVRHSLFVSVRIESFINY